MRPELDGVRIHSPNGRKDTPPSRYAGRTVLAVGAHPDDVEIGIGGTVASLVQGGAKVVMAVGCIPNQFERRLAETRESAEILGAELRLMLPDKACRVEDVKTYELVRILDALMKEFQPAVVLTHGSADFHHDHTILYNACLSSQRLGFTDFFCYYPTMTRPVPVTFQPKAYVDISATIATKLKAIRAHPSQFQERGLDIDIFVQIAREQGRLAGVPYAEGLEVMRLLVQ